VAIAMLIISLFLGLIPASIAKGKGYSFGLWWIYGWLLFIVALIHAGMIPDRNGPGALNTPQYYSPPPSKSADEFQQESVTEEEATLTFLRRTPEEARVFGGDVFIDIDGRNVGRLGDSDFHVKLEEGKHTIKMYKSHTYETFIGYAETELNISANEHLMVRYSAPMTVTQPGNMVVSQYSKTIADSETQRRENALIQQRQSNQASKENTVIAFVFVILFIVVLTLILIASA